jgi:putative ABC transport system permease protein
VDPDIYNYLYAKIAPENITSTIQYIKNVVKDIEPRFPFEFHFLDDALDTLYRNEQRMNTIFKYFTVLAIFVACLGLFGLSSYSAESRTKEIGIRKVLGASIPNILQLLSREFLILVGLSNIIAWPLAYLAMTQWLQSFAYRINIGLLPFVMTGIFVFFIALITINLQAVKAARSNPAECLRYE